jgi:glycosyltransferase involved in cell wall biosynthesis
METVAARGARRGKLVFLPNGADLALFHPRPARNPVADRLGLGDGLVVMYSGLLGMKHGLETVVEAADLCRSRPDVTFCLVGDGPRRAALLEMVRERGLGNVLLPGELPMAEVPDALARADICVTHLLPEPYLTKIIPVKVFEYMAMEKPVVAGLEGEGAQVVERAGGGVAVPPGDPRALADAVLALADDPERRREMGRRGRAVVEAEYSREATARKLEDALQQLCG